MSRYLTGLPGSSAWNTPPRAVHGNADIADWLRDLAGCALVFAQMIDPQPTPAPVQPTGTESAPGPHTDTDKVP